MRVWLVETVPAATLVKVLNGIEQSNGTVFAVLDGTSARQQHCTVIYYLGGPYAREPKPKT